MSTPTPIDPQSSQPPVPASAETPVAPTPGFEVVLDRFWRKHGRTVMMVCVVILIGIVLKGAFDWYRRSQEAAIGREFKDATSTGKLKSFVAAHSSHELAGLALLALADEAYREKNYGEAATSYQRAFEVLKTGHFAARAALGGAVAKIQAGQAAEGVEKLKQLANDMKHPVGIRAEAAYHAATTLADQGQVEEAAKLADLANSVGGGSMWGQMSAALRASLPVAVAPAPPAATPKP